MLLDITLLLIDELFWIKSIQVVVMDCKICIVHRYIHTFSWMHYTPFMHVQLHLEQCVLDLIVLTSCIYMQANVCGMHHECSIFLQHNAIDVPLKHYISPRGHGLQICSAQADTQCVSHIRGCGYIAHHPCDWNCILTFEFPPILGLKAAYAE